MIRTILYIVTSFALVSTVHANQVKQETQKVMPVVKEFAGKLKGELKSNLKSGGPVNAISVCREKAPGIAETIGKKHNLKIARTSLKLRNHQNKPDAYELEVLNQFEKRKANGEDVKKMMHASIVEMNGKKVFRLMKALPTAEACLKCHAEKIDPKVEAKLKRLYPSDKARGFKVGDIRGAITILKELN